MTEKMVEIRLTIPGAMATAGRIWHVADRMCSKSFPRSEEPIEALKKAFLGLTCENCEGSGKTGTNYRTCPDCSGTGWRDGVSPIQREEGTAEREEVEIPEGARWADTISPPWYYRVRGGHIQLCNSFDLNWINHGDVLLGIHFPSDDDALWVLDHYAEERAWRRLEE